MKKLLAIFLSTVILLTFSACAGNGDTELTEPQTTVSEEETNPETEAPTEAATEAPTEAPTEPPATEPQITMGKKMPLHLRNHI